MAGSIKPKTKFTKRLIISILLISTLFPQKAKSDTETAKVAIIAFLALMIGLSDMPRVRNQIRRRVTFLNRTSNLNHTGGVTIDVKQPKMTAKLYFYDYPKFGSRGKYIEFKIDPNEDLLPGRVTDRNSEAKFKEFWFAAYANIMTKKLNFTIKSKSLEETEQDSNEFPFDDDGKIRWMIVTPQITTFLNNLKIQSNDRKYPNLDLEVVKVNDEPRSWIVRLVFYIFNFFWMILVYGLEHKEISNQLGRLKTVPQRSSLVYFLVSLIAIRLALTYYFISVVYFWLPAFFYALGRLSNLKKFKRQKCLLNSFGTVAVSFFLVGFIFLDYMPFFIVFFNFSLTFDLLTDKRVGKKEAGITFLQTWMANIYISFLCYNPGNQTYYYPDLESAILFFSSIGGLSIFNIVLICLLDVYKKRLDCFYRYLSGCKGFWCCRRKGRKGEKERGKGAKKEDSGQDLRMNQAGLYQENKFGGSKSCNREILGKSGPQGNRSKRLTTRSRSSRLGTLSSNHQPLESIPAQIDNVEVKITTNKDNVNMNK